MLLRAACVAGVSGGGSGVGVVVVEGIGLAGGALLASAVPLAICSGMMRSTMTSALPGESTPSLWAATYDKSITRPPKKGPRSLMRSTTVLPVATRVTRT